MDAHEINTLREMQVCLEQIEHFTSTLKNLGQGVPAIEKNSCMILSAIYNLKFGLSDVADILADQGGQ